MEAKVMHVMCKPNVVSICEEIMVECIRNVGGWCKVVRRLGDRRAETSALV